MLTVSQLRVLSNPLREEVLALLCRESLSGARLRERLPDPPGNLYYHLEKLHAAGLVEVVEERPVRGVTEKFYRAVVPNFSVAPAVLAGLSRAGAEPPLLATLRRYAALTLDELGSSLREPWDAPPLTSHQRLRLTPEAAERLRAKLAGWLEECRLADGEVGDADEGAEQEWLLFAAFFRRAASP
ncbi:MAG TPA: helix-turn-helix domain-containing protein [Longimicrobiales bacterium]|nr:helix-turn-helix domain-containing protein [Longimicrobiales bacterium]